jgi:aryl-alcohol dehydrogenase-like predicted oxidoreductase
MRRVRLGQTDLHLSPIALAGDAFRRTLLVAAQLNAFAAERELNLPQPAVAWTLANAAVDVATVGTRRGSHLAETADAADVLLSETDIKEIDDIFTFSVRMEGPRPEGR